MFALSRVSNAPRTARLARTFQSFIAYSLRISAKFLTIEERNQNLPSSTSRVHVLQVPPRGLAPRVFLPAAKPCLHHKHLRSELVLRLKPSVVRPQSPLSWAY